MFHSVLRSRRTENAASAINIAPLIDMVFILLIFFMVTTTFVRDTGIDVRRPQATEAQRLDADSLRVSVTMNGAVYVDGARVDLRGLRDRVARFVAEEASSSVVIVPDEETSAGRLVEVMDAAKAAGASDIAVATREKEV